MRSLLGCSLGLLFISMNANAQSDILPFKAHEKTLANGLKVIVVPTGFPNIVSIQIPVQTGSRNEVEPGKSGFAHFFEHMMFRGTPKMTPEQYQALMTRSGARSNAYTTDDYTNYHTTFAKEDLEAVLAAEADRFQNLSYSEAAFKTESRAVLGEYNKNSADPTNKLIEVQRDAAYQAHTYKHTTMGFLKDIEDMPNQFAYSRTFFERWYRPEYTTLIVAGDVTPEAAFALVEKHWGGWKPGSYKVEIPKEPAPRGPVYAHVAWEAPTLPLVTVAFHGPAFSTVEKDFAAFDTLVDLNFGPTSDLYKRLVEQEQKVDQLFTYFPNNLDPYLATVFARVKRAEDAVYVRDEILKTFAASTSSAIDARRLADFKSNARYAFTRGLDSTDRIAASLARFVRIERSYDTLNRLFRVYESLTPPDLQAAARKYVTDAGLVVATLSKGPLPDAVKTAPSLASLVPAAGAGAALRTVTVNATVPQLQFKLLFQAGSAYDPPGKAGLAALSASMIAEAGSRSMKIDEVKKALFPMAASFSAQVDKEMTTFTGSVHRDNLAAFLDIALPLVSEPGFRDEDFARLKDAQRNALEEDLKASNDEELGKEVLQADVFAGTPYGHTVLGAAAELDALSLDDVKAFVKAHYTRANLTLGVSGTLPEDANARLMRELAKLPEGPAPAVPQGIAGRTPRGREVTIVDKETRATAISFGYPIPVKRGHPDFPALYLVRTWLGEHRSSMARLYERIREARGMNYGDYAYIEAFPRGMFQFFPDPNLGRRAQLFEVWIRPLRGHEDAHMALRIAIHELDTLAKAGLSATDFEATRNYLMKNVFVMTATQAQQLGYALDSQWYGIPEFTEYMRGALQKLSLADVNRVVRKYVQTRDLHIVMVTKDGAALKDRLVKDAPSAVKYDAPKPELSAEDARIGSLKLGIRPEAVKVVPLDQVFAGNKP
jgi:zinc protease